MSMIERNRENSKVALTEKEFTADVAIKSVKEIATSIDVLMDKEFLEDSRGQMIFISSKGAPRQVGYYFINRKYNTLEKITRGQTEDLGWHEILYVFESVAKKADEGGLLGLVIGKGAGRGNLVLNGSYIPTAKAKVAHKRADALLRK